MWPSIPLVQLYSAIVLKGRRALIDTHGFALSHCILRGRLMI